MLLTNVLQQVFLKEVVLKVLTKSLKNNAYFIVKSCRQTKITYPAEAYFRTQPNIYDEDFFGNG